MRRREENNQDHRENTGKMSRLAKSVMAAGLAVGGATAFGDMSVFAAENGDCGDPGVTVDTNAQSDVEQHSVEIPTGVVSVSSEVTTTVSAPAPAASEPAPAATTPAPAMAAPAVASPAAATPAAATPAPVASESTSTTTPETGGSETTKKTTKTEKDIYYVDPSTIGDYENVNETPGEGRTHLYDHETTITTTTTTTETSSEETVDVSERKTETVKDIARDIAGDTNKNGQYSSEIKVSEDGKVTTETGSVVDTEVTFPDKATTITTTTTADVTKTTTTETKNDFKNEDAANNWANEEGFVNGSITKIESKTVETEKGNYLSEQEAKLAADL